MPAPRWLHFSRRRGAAAWWLILAALASGCAPALRDGERVAPIELRVPLLISTPDGLLSGDAGEALLEALAGNRQQALMLLRLAHLEQRLTGEPLSAGNVAELLVDGPAAYDAMFAAMAGARHHIHMETYILDAGETGQRLAEILIERRHAGVEVRLTYDGFGSRGTPAQYFERLRSGGIELYEYRPPDPVKDPRLWRINNRHHRKILVVDGRVGFTGGINISDVYRESSFARRLLRGSRAVDLERGWRDTHVRITGPAVAHLQALFLTLWNEQPNVNHGGGHAYFPPLPAAGGDLVRMVDSRGGDERTTLHEVIHAAVSLAGRRLWLTQSYFSPDPELLEAIAAAARRGVDVRIVLPAHSDAPLVLAASRSHYDQLLQAGVRIFERKDSVLHAKTMVVDGVWSTVGSSNFDYRSFLHNNEANAVIVGPGFARQMERLFERDLQHSVELTLESWRRRPLHERLKETFGSLFRYWL